MFGGRLVIDTLIFLCVSSDWETRNSVLHLHQSRFFILFLHFLVPTSGDHHLVVCKYGFTTLAKLWTELQSVQRLDLLVMILVLP